MTIPNINLINSHVNHIETLAAVMFLLDPRWTLVLKMFESN